MVHCNVRMCYVMCVYALLLFLRSHNLRTMTRCMGFGSWPCSTSDLTCYFFCTASLVKLLFQRGGIFT